MGCNPLNRFCGIAFLNAPICTLNTSPSGKGWSTGMGLFTEYGEVAASVNTSSVIFIVVLLRLLPDVLLVFALLSWFVALLLLVELFSCVEELLLVAFDAI